MDSLRYWVEEMHVDGFRFDLAATMGRRGDAFDYFAPFFQAVAQDPVLQKVKMIAEPWDIGPNGYQVGGFPKPWRELNGRYRDRVRRFWRGEIGAAASFAKRLCGSQEIFAPSGRPPQASINFVISHDGFTLRDLWSYDSKHNEANGEDNRDGDNNNHGWNGGVEGETKDKEILATRRKLARACLATMFCSLGVPFICAGDERWRTQGGNNNAYCQDNEISWIDWRKNEVADGMVAFVSDLTRFRRECATLRRTAHFTGRVDPLTGVADVTWLDLDGGPLPHKEWHDPERRCFGAVLDGTLLVLFNSSAQDVIFAALPAGEWIPSLRHLERAQLSLQGRLQGKGDLLSALRLFLEKIAGAHRVNETWQDIVCPRHARGHDHCSYTPHMRQTKILVTLGPATESVEKIKSLIQAGANIFRLNMSHASHDWVRDVYGRIRHAAVELDNDVAVLMDLTGPSIRTGDLATPWQLKVGDKVEFRTDEAVPASLELSTTVNYPGITGDLKPGDPIAIDGGLIQMKTVATNGKRIIAEVMTGGEMKSRRHINLPGVDVNLPPLTKKDYADLDLGVELAVDYFALSFAREPGHIQHLELLLEQKCCTARVIAKIENQQALKNLDTLVLASKGIMVARGDLGSECPVEELPIISRRDIIERCSYHGRKVIVATQMLESMIENPVPTRAEVTDIFNAVIEQVDCVMLSGETSVGKYPDRCVEVLNKVAMRTEQRYPSGRFASDAPLKTNKHKTVKATVVLANSIQGSKLMVFTKGGVTAHLLAHQRPEFAPIFAFTPNLHVSRALMTARGVSPFVMDFGADPQETIIAAFNLLKKRKLIVTGDPVVILSDTLHDELVVDSILLRLT